MEDACVWSSSASRRSLDGFDFCERRVPCCCCISEGDSGSLALVETAYFCWLFDWKGFEDVEARLVVTEEVEGSVIGGYLEVGVKNGWLRMF